MSSVEFEVEGIDDIVRELQAFADSEGMVKAGVIETSENYAEVMQYAPVQEFGGKIPVTQKMRGFLAYNYGIFLKKSKTHIVIPSRPFMRTTFAKHWEEWADIIAQYLQQGVSTDVILRRVGSRMVDDIVDTIMSNMPPKLTEMTKIIESQSNRGPGNIDRTLYESGQMAHSINFEVAPYDESA